MFIGGFVLSVGVTIREATAISDSSFGAAALIILGMVLAFIGLCFAYFNAPLPSQKKAMNRILCVAIFFFLVGFYFKTMHWIGANFGVAIGLLLFCFSYLPLIVKYRYETRKHIFNTRHVILSLSDLTSLILIFLALLFRHLHWPGGNAILVIGIVGFLITMILRNREFSKEVLLRHDAETKIKFAFGQLEEKNKEILDSITYAQRIQKALLASDSILKKNLPDHFVLFKPKDIVSGDFYWACEAHGKFYFIIADSTGHGVPGAFMSLLNISFLNEAINEKGIQKPNDILAHVRARLIASLTIEGSNEGGNDGMDCILMCFDKNTLEVSCAHNPLLLIHHNELKEIAADKIPVGKSLKNEMPFTLHTINLNKGDVLYAFTDGFADQFGGPQGKKLKYKQLCNTLLQNKDLPSESQKENLLKLFSDWKGTLEQVDDVLIAGIRI